MLYPCVHYLGHCGISLQNIWSIKSFILNGLWIDYKLVTILLSKGNNCSIMQETWGSTSKGKFCCFFFFLSLSLPSSLELVIYQGFQDFWFLTCCGLDHKTKLIPVDFCSSLLGRSAGNMFFFILFIILFLIMVFNESNTLSFRYTFNKILPSFPGAATAWCSSQHSYWNLAQIDNCFVFVFNSWPCNACINK